MSNHNQFLVNWVKSAYSMELGLVPMLEEQSTLLEHEPELRDGLDLHLEKTRQHVELLRRRLERMGQNPETIPPTHPIMRSYGLPADGMPEPARRTELLDFVNEAFEVASYRALAALSRMLGDDDTGQICEQILHDELAITDALDQRLPGHNGTGHAPGHADHKQGNVEMALAYFQALNAGDMEGAEHGFAHDFQAFAPGVPDVMDRQQNRAYFQAYQSAFPDIHFTIDRTIASGDDVVIQWTATGTHSGPLQGPQGQAIPATGRVAKVHGSSSFECRDGKIVRSRVYFDSVDMLRQLRVLPGAGAVQARAIVHLEIPAEDPDALGGFYHKMFGWEHEHVEAGFDYTTFRSGNIGGGFVGVEGIYEPGRVVLYVGSDDIEGDLRRAEELGARTVVPKTEIPGMGSYAILADPTGNHVGLFGPG